MTAADTWPDAATYVMLTAPPVAAATQGLDEDNETDLYLPPTPEVPFTVPHLYTSLSVTSPLITGFPVTVRALMDIGCPAQ
jgi:hypothetical protein